MLALSIKFSGAYLVLQATTAAISQVLEVNLGTSLSLATTLAASFYAAWLFARQEGRPPTPQEIKDFSSRALLGSCLVSLALVVAALALFVPANEVQGLLEVLRRPIFIIMALFAMLVVGGFQYLAIRISFGWFAKRAARDAKIEA